MKKVILRVFLVLVLVLATQAVSGAQAGVGGVGNTGDISVEFDFAREVAVQTLRKTSVFDLFESSGDRNLRDFYRSCREAMFRGAATAEFKLVDEIQDGNRYHALAKRVGAEIWISRTEMERLSANSLLSASTLIAVIIHEVGHDCVIEGRPVDDAFDARLNNLALELSKASQNMTVSSYRDIEFISAVERRESVRLQQLSPSVKGALATAYLNYMGDWVFRRYEDRFRFRPAPASDFYATSSTSIFLGWNSLNQILVGANREINTLVFGVLRGTFEERSLAYYDSFERVALPTALACSIRRDTIENMSVADCSLDVFWAPLPAPALQTISQRIDFTVNAFGNLELRQISVHDQAPRLR